MESLTIISEENMYVDLVDVDGKLNKLVFPKRHGILWDAFAELSKTYDVIIDNGKVILSEKS